MACELFGFQREELIGNQLADLLSQKSDNPCTVAESHLEENGNIIETSGQVVSILKVPFLFS